MPAQGIRYYNDRLRSFPAQETVFGDASMSETTNTNTIKHTRLGRNKWGYIFLVPFFVTFLVFSLWPLIQTIYFSFFTKYTTQMFEEVEEFCGLKNYKEIFSADTMRLFFNTFVLWIIGFVPQILVSLLLASWFANNRLRIRASGFFKTVIYLPNLIMAIAFGMIFYLMFARSGPLFHLFENLGFITGDYDFWAHVGSTRILISSINFLMWFGNTTILLMAGIMGINDSLFEAAEVDGASQFQVFRKITLPILKPILVYVMITSLIGGIQMFDVPQIITKGMGNPAGRDIFKTSQPAIKTVIMQLSASISKSNNYGSAGALSVVLLIVTGILSFLVYLSMVHRDDNDK